MTKRPLLVRVGLQGVLSDLNEGRAQFVITMSVGQWDSTLEGFYKEGATLIELDNTGQPVAAYNKTGPSHKHQYIQKVDELDRLRWHECRICKKYQECNCDEETFRKRLEEGEQ